MSDDEIVKLLRRIAIAVEKLAGIDKKGPPPATSRSGRTGDLRDVLRDVDLEARIHEHEVDDMAP